MAARRKILPVHKLVYWDACIWIAWLNEESRQVGDMEGVITTVNHVASGATTLVVSQLIPRLEVPQDKMTRDAQKIFSDALSRPNVVIVDMEAPILALTKEIVRFYKKEHRAGRMKARMEWEDALHLATAINRKVEAFYTFDSGKRSGLDLLSLDRNVAGHDLHICKPPYGQAPLLF